MSSPPEPRTFEGWIEEDWPGATQRPDVMAVLEPYREGVQYALDDFDDETQSWRDQCGRIYGWGPKPHNEGAVPYAVQDKVSEMMSREPEPIEATKPDTAPGAPDLDAWRTEAGEAAALANKATPGPWVAHNDGSLVSVADPAGPDLFEVLPHPRGAGEPLDFGPCKPNATWAAAARTGWPRDAARVGVLADEVERLTAEVRHERDHADVAILRAALLEACNGWDMARKSATPPRRADAETIARLRTIAAGTAPAKDPAR